MDVLGIGQIHDNLEKLNSWELVGEKITKKFQFNDFKESIEFVKKVAELAENINHHPDITINYNVVSLTVFTHSKGVITEKDFELAAKIDEIDRV